jgi:putative methyltransferase (TIGR01177 family)
MSAPFRKGMRLLFLLSQEHLDLARAECVALHPEAKGWTSLAGGAALLADSPVDDSKRAAFTKEAFLVHVEGSKERVIAFLQKPHPLPEGTTVRIEIRDLGESVPSLEARRLLIPWLGRPGVDLERPDKTFVLITTPDEWFVGELLWRNEEDFEGRKSHRRPAPHPTSLHPKLARSLINLGQPKGNDVVLDPFCGSGGILLEAGLLGHRVIGVDIDPAMVERARTNLTWKDVKATVEVGDATTTEKRGDVVVTDLPYGRNSKAAPLEGLYSGFLRHAKSSSMSGSGRMVVCFPDLVDAESIVKESGWSIVGSFSWRLHKTLCKRILILE